MSLNPIIPVILCGGSGTRLWPLSRKSFPKQFLSLTSDDKDSLLQKTIKRVSNLKKISSPILVCNEEHRFLVAEQMRGINIKNFSILLEPFGRNTAPAIAISALKALEKNDDPILLILSSDHEILNKEKFINTLNAGINYAENEKLVTFGILPTSPETGYGYIKAAKPFTDNLQGIDIKEFLEKPDLERAKELIEDKRFTWNSGIFMFKAKTIIEEIKKYSPDIIKYCQESLKQSRNDLDFVRLEKMSFEKCPNISIDCAVMEKTKKGTVLPLDANWNDIGSWQSVWEVSNKDKNGNFTKGKTIIKNTKNCYLSSEERLVVGIGLKDLIVVETNDAILVSNKSESQKVKEIVKILKDEKIPQGLKHSKIYRPWGNYKSIIEKDRWQVKLIEVKAKEKLSLQMHHHRSEHWIIVRGTAEVEVDDKTKILTENESIYIPLGSKHRLTNPGKIPLALIEVQSGSYVGEDDIVRFEDKYGRLK
tara:strand:+ start:286 stop:1722 length:1437 start_codon:yes stop_codon:yes gene_type:complete